MLKTLSPRRAALASLLLCSAVIAGAFVFQWAGYAPCDLCLKQRWAYYAMIALTGVLTISPPSVQRPGLWLAALIMLGSMVFGIYHAGVEWKFWAGPGTCGAGDLSGLLPDLSKPTVKCDEAALRILGLSLAGWNAIVSALAVVLAVSGARNHGSSSASQ
jgi:disulfide bond formation protein DsbB